MQFKLRFDPYAALYGVLRDFGRFHVQGPFFGSRSVEPSWLIFNTYKPDRVSRQYPIGGLQIFFLHL